MADPMDILKDEIAKAVMKYMVTENAAELEFKQKFELRCTGSSNLDRVLRLEIRGDLRHA